MTKANIITLFLTLIFVITPLFVMLSFFRTHTGRVLIAAPSMSAADARFAGALLYLDHHGIDGARGYVLNKPLDGGGHAYWGGPLSPDTYFIVSAPLDHQYGLDVTTVDRDSIDLEKPYLAGYTGWGRLQLNYEIFKKHWVVRDYDVSYSNALTHPESSTALGVEKSQ